MAIKRQKLRQEEALEAQLHHTFFERWGQVGGWRRRRFVQGILQVFGRPSL